MLWEVGGAGVASITCASARVDRARLAALLSVLPYGPIDFTMVLIIDQLIYYGPDLL